MAQIKKRVTKTGENRYLSRWRLPGGAVPSRSGVDLSVDAFVLLPWYECLFSDDERREARRRLDANAFDVYGLLSKLQSPAWCRGAP